MRISRQEEDARLTLARLLLRGNRKIAHLAFHGRFLGGGEELPERLSYVSVSWLNQTLREIYR